MDYKCYHCTVKFSDLVAVIDHCIDSHDNELLRYRQLALCEKSGCMKYQTKIHEGIVPCELRAAGKEIQVRDDKVYVLDDRSKKKRLNTPVKGKEVRRNLTFSISQDKEKAEMPDQNDDIVEQLTEKSDNECLSDSLEEMQHLLPSVLRTLQEEGHLENYMKFNYLLASRDFPMTNICYLLFLDLVEWFSSENTSQMRYRPETVKFWQIGYRLFHGKFLRFMSGLRNFGQILEGVSERGSHDPLESKLNFAVPSRNNLYPKRDESELFYPGINESSIVTLAKSMSGKPMKLSVDAKKISRGKGKRLGDIDCWGHENKPTLEERKSVLKTQVSDVEAMQNNIDTLEGKGLTQLPNIPTVERLKLLDNLKVIVQNLATNNSLLREKVTSLEHMEVKFKKLGGEDWKNSRFYPIICSVRVANTETKKQIEDSLLITNKLAFYGATLNHSQEQFCSSETVLLSEQTNLNQLNSEFPTADTRFIPQRSGKWFEIREAAMVTGSTCHKALGIGTLTQQKEHYDVVVKKAERSSVSEVVQHRMEYGTLHEIDAIATVTAKVLPFLYPDYAYFEEGCIQVPFKEHTSFMVVSPDGTFRKSLAGAAVMMYENKCKAPHSFSSSAYYKIPDYYVVQLLSEMYAYGCSELLFTCWSEKSMTVFRVNFDVALWEICWNELTRLYGEEKKVRPTRFSPVAKSLKTAVKKFTETNVTLLGEFPACKAILQSIDMKDQENPTPYIKSIAGSRVPEKVCLSQLQESLVITKKWFEQTYHLLRTVATEILVFMVNDLDRVYDMESSNAHPVAYALKGSSMKSDTFRNMTDDVISRCEANGLKIAVTASDGQWHQYGVRDSDEKPLTLHQLHRDHWTAVKAKDKSTILADIKGTWKVDSLDDVTVGRETNGLVVYGHSRDSPLRMLKWSQEEINQESNIANTGSDTEYLAENYRLDQCLGEECEDNFNTETEDQFDVTVNQPLGYSPFLPEVNDAASASYDIDEDITWLYHSETNASNAVCDTPPDDFNQTISVLHSAHDAVYGNLVFDEMSISQSQEGDYIEQYSDNTDSMINSDINYNSMDVHTSGEQIAELYPTPSSNIEQAGLPSNIPDAVSSSTGPSERLFDDKAFFLMLSALQNDEKAMKVHNWSTVDQATFATYFGTKRSLEQHFQKHELALCLYTISESFSSSGIEFKRGWPKYRLVEFTMEHLHDHVQTQNTHVPVISSSRRTRRNPTSLRKLCGIAIAKFSKHALMVILAENTWDKVFRDWQNIAPIPNGISIDGVCNCIQWFSYPCVGQDGNIRFHFTDACHILTCLRTKICTTGISGLSRKAWEMAALSDETSLNISVVVDCVDKQDVALARRLFSMDVEVAMTPEYPNEAKFCKLVREWFDAEDEPSISAVDRCKKRMALRNWLLQGYQIGKFPPPTRYVRGVPIITYEGLLANIERKLQLYAFVPNSMYNVRATGSQEVENFFSTFRDLEPTGKGIPKPDLIPEMMSAVAEVDNFRLDPDKPFYVKTSRASVYPYQTFMSNYENTDNQPVDFIRLPTSASGVQRICPRDHFFDSPERDTRRHTRPSGKVSKPDESAYGEHGVRQWHARDDSKINPIHRMGWLTLPESPLKMPVTTL